MPKQKLTKRSVDAAKAVGKEYVIWDNQLSGFGLKVTKKGGKSFIFRYRMGGRGFPDRRVTIGSPSNGITAEQARKEAEKHAIAVAQGIDPQEQRKQIQLDAISLAFDRYAEFYIEKYLKNDCPKSWPEAARLLRTNAIPHFKHKPLPSINKRDIQALMDNLADRKGIARNTYANIRKLLKTAFARGDISSNPMDGMRPPEKVAVGDRYLDDTEIAALWIASQNINHPYAALIRTLLLTGQRRDEVADMVWEEIDLEKAVWSLPGGNRTKNGKPHDVPLSDAAMEELVASRIDDCEFVFSASASKPIQNWSYWKRKIDVKFTEEMSARGELPPAPWKIHDLRRTVATGLQRLGVAGDVVEAIQSREVREGVAGRYQHHDYPTEKRAALELWSNHIATLVKR